jgi:hypothetical protein
MELRFEPRLAIPGDRAQVGGCGFVHFFDHAVDRYSCDLIPGIFRQQIEGVSLASMRLDADYSAAGDGLADVDLAGPDPGHTVHPAQIDGCAARKTDPQKNGFWTLQVRMLLENPNRPAAKAYDEVSRFELFNGTGSGRSVHSGVFRNAREHQFNSGEGGRSAHQRCNQTATAEGKERKTK